MIIRLCLERGLQQLADRGGQPHRVEIGPREPAACSRRPFEGAQASLPLYIYQQYANSSGSTAAYDRAWAASLTLIAFVMILNLVARGIARWKAPR